MEKSKNSETINSENTSNQSGADLNASVTYTDETVSVYNNVVKNDPIKRATGFNHIFSENDPSDSVVTP